MHKTRNIKSCFTSAIMLPDGQCRQQSFAAVTHTAEYVMAASWLVVVHALVSGFGKVIFMEWKLAATTWDLSVFVAYSIHMTS